VLHGEPVSARHCGHIEISVAACFAKILSGLVLFVTKLLISHKELDFSHNPDRPVKLQQLQTEDSATIATFNVSNKQRRFQWRIYYRQIRLVLNYSFSYK